MDNGLTSYSDILPDLACFLPQASQYMLETLAYTGTFENVEALKTQVEDLRKTLQIDADPLDDLLIEVVLLRQSQAAAVRKVAVYKSRRAVTEIAQALVLDEGYKALLLNHYASLASATLFLEECDKRSSEPGLDFKNNAEFARIIDSLISDSQAGEAAAAQTAQENRDFLTALFKDKRIPHSLYTPLLEAYGLKGALDFRQRFGDILKRLGDVYDNPSQNVILACKVMLYVITEEEAASISELARVVKYPLLQDDLQNIAFKYLKLKTSFEVSEILEAVLKRLPYLDDPVENLGLAVRVMCDGREETLKTAEISAENRKNKVIFMRKLSALKLFSGYEDELTSRFYGHSTMDEVNSMFHNILKELPNSGDIYENADIAVKVLLKKLPLKDAAAQAGFRSKNKETSAAPVKGVEAIESEAFESYLGTKSREEVSAFFKDKLAPFTFWKEDETKHCYALSVMVGELNGTISAFISDLSMYMLDNGYPEEGIDIIAAGLSSSENLTKESILTAYEKFYTAGKDHKDAAHRVVNMLQ